MTQAELCDVLAMIATYLPSQVRLRILALLPEDLRKEVLNHQEHINNLESLPVVAQGLKKDLDMLFEKSGMSSQSEILSLRLSDVLSFILRKGTPQQASDIVRRLPESVESDVIQVIASQGSLSFSRRLGPEELGFLQTLCQALELASYEPNPAFAAEVLRLIQNPGIIRRILTLMYDKDPDSTGHVQDLIFGFNELVHLSDRELQAVLNGVDHWDLILALRPAPVGVRRKVIANLSERRAKMFEEDEKVLEDVDDAQVMMLQHQIMDRARLLYETGVIHTYLGSIERENANLLPDVSQSAKGGTGDIEAVVKKKKRRNPVGYLVGILVIASVVVIVILLNRYNSNSELNLRGKTRPDVANLSTAKTDSAAQSKAGERIRRSSGAMGNAAVISGRAILTTGEKVRSMDSGVAPGDRLQTDAEGRASVDLWGDSGQVQVGENTDVQFGQPQQTQHAPPKLDLRIGNVWVRVNNPLLEVSSPVVLMTGTIGALYHLSISLNATTVVSVHRGTVWVKNPQKPDQPVFVLGTGDRLRVEPDGDVIREKHNDPLDSLGSGFQD